MDKQGIFGFQFIAAKVRKEFGTKAVALVLFILKLEENLITIHSYHFVGIVVILQPFSEASQKEGMDSK